MEYFEDPWCELDDGLFSARRALFSTKFSSKISARSLVDSLMIRDPLKRMTVYGALAHTWIRKEIDDLEALYRLRIASQL